MKTIGIIGGGQLGLMIIEQAHLLGARTVCLDPAADAPAFALSDERIVAAYDDPAALEELCRRSDAVTYEFENVPGSVLIPLEKKYNIPQGFRPLYDSQDRLREKDNARAGGLATPEYAAADDEASLRAAVAKIGLPAVLEQCAEELAELTQASLKMARKLRGENPTPVTHAQAAAHLHEELGDVRLCLKVLDVAMGGYNTTAVEAEKLRRWLERITQEQKNPE